MAEVTTTLSKSDAARFERGMLITSDGGTSVVKRCDYARGTITMKQIGRWGVFWRRSLAWARFRISHAWWWLKCTWFDVVEWLNTERCQSWPECDGRVRIVGPWGARRRECIYCENCMLGIEDRAQTGDLEQ